MSEWTDRVDDVKWTLPVLWHHFGLVKLFHKTLRMFCLFLFLKETITSNVYQLTSLTIPENIRVKRRNIDKLKKRQYWY